MLLPGLWSTDLYHVLAVQLLIAPFDQHWKVVSLLFVELSAFWILWFSDYATKLLKKRLACATPCLLFLAFFAYLPYFQFFCSLLVLQIIYKKFEV